MLDEYPMGSEEREIILNRLKIGQVIQGEIIDGVKGVRGSPVSGNIGQSFQNQIMI